jgi:hypothetical protein
MQARCPELVTDYYRRGKSLVCELGGESDVSYCEFWPEAELQRYNDEYQVPTYAPGYFAFASNGGGEIYALSQAAAVVRLPCIGMAPEAALMIATSWSDFERMLRPAQ